jgi:23S rRNA (adenine-N6)-dimethyltransferase
MVKADIVVQWEVARKRTAHPPSTLLSTIWAPWWEIGLRHRIPAADFPRVDAGYLAISRRDPPILPPTMAGPYADFVRQHWPFDR